MPKVTGPLFSVEADGALGKVLTYQRRPGGASVYGYKKPKIPLTDRQQWQRDLIKWCVYEWQQLTAEEKVGWEDKAVGQGQSGYSYFMHQRRGYVFDPDVALYLPLYDTRLKDTQFLSMESHGHLCTVTGALWTSQGRSFNGVGDYITIENHASLDLTGDYTIIFWVNLSSLGSTQYVINKKIDANNGYAIAFYRLLAGAGANWNVLNKQAGVSTQRGTGNLSYQNSLNVWKCLAARVASGVISFFDAGQSVTLGAIGGWAYSTDTDLILGKLGGAASSLNGKLPVVRIILSALSDGEILNIFNQKRHLFGV